MRIVSIIPGSGGAFYCQNCQRDLALAEALRRQGHDVLIVPLYLPLEAGVRATVRPFYGAVGLYLRHVYPHLGRLLPAGFWRALDAHPVLRLAARYAGSTRADGLSDLTLSMLRGEAGRQAEELDRLVAWLRDTPGDRPDVICLSNALLLGMARRLKAELGVPVVCWLQDEHVWADAMPPEATARIWQELRARAAEVDGFAAVSRHYALRMSAALGVPAARIRTIHPGVQPAAGKRADAAPSPRTVGFLSRLAAGEGFGAFVDAFLALHREPRFADVHLRATGGLPGDRRYLGRQLARLRAAGLAKLVQVDPLAFAGDRAAFLASLSLLSVPVPGGEAFGIPVVEAMAAGVPVVLPPVGAYPEILAEAGCGVLSDSARAEDLAAAWGTLLDDPGRCMAEAAAGREAVSRHFNVTRMATEFAVFCAQQQAATIGSTK